MKPTSQLSSSASDPPALPTRQQPSVLSLGPPPHACPLHPSTSQGPGLPSARSILGNGERLLCPHTQQAGRAGDAGPGSSSQEAPYKSPSSLAPLPIYF